MLKIINCWILQFGNHVYLFSRESDFLYSRNEVHENLGSQVDEFDFLISVSLHASFLLATCLESGYNCEVYNQAIYNGDSDAARFLFPWWW